MERKDLNRDLDVINILDNPLIKSAAYVQRYTGSKLIDQENLSTHVYEVQMIGLFLINHIIEDSEGKEDINIGEFLMKALFHDADETVIGDTPRPLKYASKGIKEEIDKVAHKIGVDLITSSFNHEVVCTKYYTESKEGKTGVLVRLADMLCVIKKLRVEVEFLNNFMILDIIKNSQKYVNDLDREEIYSVFSESTTRAFIFHLFQELKEYLDYMEDKYL